MSAASEFVGGPRHGGHPGSAPVGAAVGAVPQGAPAEDRQAFDVECIVAYADGTTRRFREVPTPPTVPGVYPPVTPGTGWEVPWIR